MATVKEAVISYLKDLGKPTDPVLTYNNTRFLYDIGKIEVKLKDDSIDIFYVEDFIFSEKRTLSGKAFGKIYEVEYDKPYVRDANGLEREGNSIKFLDIVEVVCHPLNKLPFEEVLERFDAWSPQTYPHIFEDVKDWMKDREIEKDEKMGEPHFLKPDRMNLFLGMLHKLLKEMTSYYNEGSYKDVSLTAFAETATLLLEHLTLMMVSMELPVRNLWLDLHSNLMVHGDWMNVHCKFHGDEIMKWREKRISVENSS